MSVNHSATRERANRNARAKAKHLAIAIARGHVVRQSAASSSTETELADGRNWQLYRRPPRHPSEPAELEWVYTSPALRDAMRPRQTAEDLLAEFPELGDDPDGSRGERSGEKAEQRKRKLAARAGEELIEHPALTGGDS